MGRRKAREITFKCIYKLAYGQAVMESKDTEIFNITEDNDEEITGEDKIFIADLIAGISANLENIDVLILSKLKNWTKERIFKVDLAVLRMAVYELVYTDVPFKVAINESIEIVKKYGDDNSPSFVNGVLREIVSDREK